MPNQNQINFIKLNKDLITTPILIIGSKEYDFDEYNYIQELNRLGFDEIIGLDIATGIGVDVHADICDLNHNYFLSNAERFKTLICMQTLYSVKDPFKATQNIQELLSRNGVLIFSDIFSHRVNRIPSDYWRFTYDAQKLLFDKIDFLDHRTKIGITRQNKLIDYSVPLPELLKYSKEKTETSVAFFLRKLYRKIFHKGLLNNQRLMPEISIHSIGHKIIN